MVLPGEPVGLSLLYDAIQPDYSMSYARINNHLPQLDWVFSAAAAVIKALPDMPTAVCFHPFFPLNYDEAMS